MASSSSRGLKVLKILENYLIKKPNQWDTLTTFNKVQITSANNGHLNGTLTVDSTMCNSLDTIHGGFVSSLVDTLSVYGQLTIAKARMAWTTNINVVYLNPAFIGDVLAVQTTPLTFGKNSIMEVVLRNQKSGAVIAKGTTCFVAGSEKYQEKFKELFGFDVNEE